MLNRFLKSIYFRVYISKYLERLQSLNELYTNGNRDEYLRQMEVFYSDLLRLPQILSQNAVQFQTNEELMGSFSNIQDEPIINIYARHIPFLLQIQELIKNRNTDELYHQSENLRLFLETLYSATSSTQKKPKRFKHPFLIGGVVILVVLFALLYSPIKARYSREKDEYNMAVYADTYREQALHDILALKAALDKYYQDNKSYPKSSGGWDAIKAAYGKSTEDWIPGLAPKYIPKLPVDPRKSTDPGNQYMYKSDGTNFKLIAHRPFGIREIISRYPEMVDPARPSWAFGVWTNEAKNW